ncbi:T6SS immunity protein Tli4 family protein [Janthinobacterium sp. K2Li3]|uniref:T6SS immunity protein Tli4 family protein n=1 Tax=Janthinobacterium sp. K2Li3 TaxID=2723081 RepID=UPI00184ED4BA|nr:T6SS immunity protein Tli4 family protein [Janthinobacterium sp. K2Li3]MBB5381661.1 hypothetical protein [Janthinobacterium sp. K2Li3]
MNIKTVTLTRKFYHQCYIRLCKLQKQQNGYRNTKPYKSIFHILIFIIFAIILQSCNKHYEYTENAVPKPVKMSNKLEILFSKTKLLCFGRYSLNVPEETQLIIGSSTIDTIKGNNETIKRQIQRDIEKIKFEDNTADIIYNGKGPIEDSWQFRYYDSDAAKEYKLLFFRTFINKGDFIFIVGDALRDGENEAMTAARQLFIANNLRLRDPQEVPIEPGLCFEHGFMKENLYRDQEIDNAGLYLPSMPDVTFSISSNKDAYGDYPPARFETEMREELSLLKRIQGAKDIQGSSYPKRTLLREGKRDVQHWHGEESLIRRTDGVHDFEWVLVGTPRDIANPSALEVKMYTKVEHNTVGAAQAASLSDDEAVALWDKLLSGLKFRVKVPGAPPGSYYIDPDKPAPAL